jgi:hypothetical protein
MLRAVGKQLHIFMRRGILPGQGGASTPDKVTLFIRIPFLSLFDTDPDSDPDPELQRHRCWCRFRIRDRFLIPKCRSIRTVAVLAMRLTRKCGFGILGSAQNASLSFPIHRGVKRDVAGTTIVPPDRFFYSMG